MEKKYKLSTLIVACAVCLLIGALILLGAVLIMAGGWDNLAYAGKYAAVAGIIEDRYIGDSDPEDMCDAAVSAMIASTGDRWSYYMTAEEYENYKEYVANAYTGVGITILQDEETGGLEIVSVNDGSPAEAAGLVSGDVLIAVDGEELTGMTTSEVKSIIQSKNGNEMHFTVIHADGSRSEIPVTSGEIKVKAVTYEMLDGNIGYIRIVNFEVGSAEGTIDAVEELTEQGAKSLIFDVRSNPGGRVSELTELLDYLLPEGDIFVSVNKVGEETVTKSDSSCVELPMAVLINADSYSAAELFAATLSEYGWAVTVGEATTGKGRSQITISLADGSAVHISTNAYLTPDRVDLSAVGGIVPDYEVANSTEGDEQLETATKILS